MSWPWRSGDAEGPRLRMLLQVLLVSLALLGHSAAERTGHKRHSFSGEYGSGSGTPFSYSGLHRRGVITALRVWEYSCSYIAGIQLQFAYTWGQAFGGERGTKHEVSLLRGERITQVSGKHSTYIYQLIISTNKGRIFFFGQPYGVSFNAIPEEPVEFLDFITGHHNGAALTGIGMHWAGPRRRGGRRAMVPVAGRSPGYPFE
ncbi:zymogen granule membrane protein 16 isoform X2 [Pelodiscus sinensis]|uniref:zymogen granule membrane protein 16 isoform X2 n=1 Tax=Pelodiscus sinensis TaxID=13735 RepID=UPI003F6B383C